LDFCLLFSSKLCLLAFLLARLSYLLIIQPQKMEERIAQLLPHSWLSSQNPQDMPTLNPFPNAVAMGIVCMPVNT